MGYLFYYSSLYPATYIELYTVFPTGTETIQGRKLFKGGNYSRKYGMC